MRILYRKPGKKNLKKTNSSRFCHTENVRFTVIVKNRRPASHRKTAGCAQRSSCSSSINAREKVRALKYSNFTGSSIHSNNPTRKNVIFCVDWTFIRFHKKSCYRMKLQERWAIVWQDIRTSMKSSFWKWTTKSWGILIISASVACSGPHCKPSHFAVMYEYRKCVRFIKEIVLDGLSTSIT